MRKENYKGKILDELIAKYLKGDEIAYNQLAAELYREMSYHVALTKNEFLYLFSDEDIAEMYSTAVMNSIKTYMPGVGRFGGYFRLILSRLFIKEGIARLRKRNHCYVVSLDEDISDDLTLADCVPDRDMDNDPKTYCTYLELKREIESTPKELAKARDVAVLLAKGYTAEEVMQMRGLSKNQVKNAAYAYRKWAKEILLPTKRKRIKD